MSTVTPTRLIAEPPLRAPLPSLISWLDSLWPAELDLALRATHGIRVEELSRDGEFILRAELPGIDVDKDLEVSLSGGVLTIEAVREESTDEEHHSEFHYGRFRRSLMLPSGVQPSDLSASYEDGILEISVHLPSESEQRQSIPVTRGE
ncbi:MAG TPA: molecular chaperone Hsp20 [Actinobacteria bacterium]|jgi:HSP20 family protein|nr:molecular chaperone Hsp20 [Actinomycetota bacterium]